MKIYDQHIHTFLSCDSEESFEAYLVNAQKLQLTHFVTTEHVDLSCRLFGKDIVPNFAKQDKLLQKFQNKYPIKLLKGVELGYKFSRMADNEAIVKDENFDLVIMSVHEDENVDCTTQGFLHSKTADESYADYLDLCCQMVENANCYDIVGHVDFLLRYIDPLDITNHHEKLCTLFDLVIAKDKCLEFNTRFLYQYNDSKYLTYIFNLYYACGGRKISLGSDAHTANKLCAGFKQAKEILQNIGFTHITVYIKREAINIKMEK